MIACYPQAISVHARDETHAMQAQIDGAGQHAQYLASEHCFDVSTHDGRM